MPIKLRSTRRGSRLLPRLAWLALILAALYSAAWFGAVQLAGPYAQQWLQSEAAQGRQWACNAPAISGFPFGLRLACAQPVLTMTGEAGAQVFTAKSLLLSFDVFSPLQFAARIEAPVTAKLKTGDTATLAAREVKAVAELQLGGAETALRGLRLSAEAPDLVVTSTTGRGFAGKAAQARFSLSATPGGHDLAFDAEGAKIPALEALTQNPAPATLHIVGLLEKFDLAGRGSPIERIERWRAAGGVLTFAKSALGNGATQLEFSGPLSLDEERRLAGKLALSLTGGAPILQRFGVPAAMLNPGALLGALLGKAKKPTEPAAEAGAIVLDLKLQDGKALAGPLPLPVELRALY